MFLIRITMNYCAVAMGVIYYQYFLNQFLCSWLAMAVDITYIVECKRVGNALLLYCWVWQCIAIRTASPLMAEKLEEVKARRGRAAEGRNRQNLQKYCFINLFEQQQKALPRFALMLLAVEDSEVKTSHWWNLRKSNEINFNFQLQQLQWLFSYLGKEGLGLQKSFGQM